MPDAVMYACTTDVKNGSTVDLKFKPISTVLKFHLDGFDTDKGLTSPTLQIQSITLTAPEGVKIAGSFGLDINRDGTISSQAASDASNTITISTVLAGGSYVSVLKDQPMEFNVFVIPQTESEVSINSDWSITVQTQDQTFAVKRYKYNLVQKDANKKNVLSAGLIHKLSIPQATIKEPTTEFNPSIWMEQIPRNVYLSELSIPGSWYSMNSDYQDETNLTNQYDKGIRAFHIDCRLTYAKATRKLGQLYDADKSSELKLVCAGTDSYPNLGTTLNATYVIDKLKELSDLMETHKKEYIVVVLSIAEKPNTSDYSYLVESGTAILGTIDPSQVIAKLSEEIAQNASSLPNLYVGKIDNNTTVNDVLGHIVLKINANTAEQNYLNYSLPNALISTASMATDKKYGDMIEPGIFNDMQISTMYWGNQNTELTYYYHQAQLTDGDGASFDSRETAIRKIIDQSHEIYTKSQHNGWFQIGLGGYTKPSRTENRIAVAQRLNPFLLDRINEKIETDPSPVGIVLMNFCTDDATNGSNGKGLALVNAIIKMNAKFRLDRDTNAPEWYDDDTQTPVQSAKEGYSSGFNVDTENWKAF